MGLLFLMLFGTGLNQKGFFWRVTLVSFKFRLEFYSPLSCCPKISSPYFFFISKEGLHCGFVDGNMLVLAG